MKWRLRLRVPVLAPGISIPAPRHAEMKKRVENRQHGSSFPYEEQSKSSI